MKIRDLKFFILSFLLLFPMLDIFSKEGERGSGSEVKKALVIGDSMAGWLGERLNAYGKENGFEVGTIVWDGATIQKYASSKNIEGIISAQNPDVIFICLGMNNLAEQNPSKHTADIEAIKKAAGGRPIVWVGPPSWPGKTQWTALNTWLADQFGSKNFFNTFPHSLPRQSATNPHPTKQGMMKWGDLIMEWLPSTGLNFPGYDKPSESQMVRGKFFLYKKMKESL